MGSDHLADGICVNQSGIKHERHKVLIQNNWLEIKVCRDQNPGDEERNETENCNAGLLAPLTADSDNILSTADGAIGEDKPADHHVRLVPSHVVEEVRNDGHVWNADSFGNGLMPEVAAAHVSSEGINQAEHDQTFDWAGDKAEGESLGVVLVPGLNVEGQQSCYGVRKFSHTI